MASGIGSGAGGRDNLVGNLAMRWPFVSRTQFDRMEGLFWRMEALYGRAVEDRAKQEAQLHDLWLCYQELGRARERDWEQWADGVKRLKAKSGLGCLGPTARPDEEQSDERQDGPDV